MNPYKTVTIVCAENGFIVTTMNPEPPLLDQIVQRSHLSEVIPQGVSVRQMPKPVETSVFIGQEELLHFLQKNLHIL